MKARRMDFVNVRLTAAGVKHVGESGSITFSNRHMHYTFKPGVAREVVLRYEWNSVLRHERINGTGEPLFEAIDDDVESPASTRSEEHTSELQSPC